MVDIRIEEKTWSLNEGITVIGRGTDADIMIEAGGLSRLHARFSVDGDTVSIEDLGSKNGTFINGSKIDSKRELGEGDELRVVWSDGGNKFFFYE